MSQSRRSLLEMPLDVGLTSDVVIDRIRQESVLISYLNPSAWSVARRDGNYKKNLSAMDIVVCDGILIKKAASRFLEISTQIISLDYSGIGSRYLELFQQTGARLCLVGGEKQVIDLACQKLRQDFPAINIVGTFHGYEEGPDSAQDFIEQTQPEVVLVGLGMGMQERFLIDSKAKGWSGTGICVGAFFDRLAKPEIDYPEWSKKHNIRFLGNIYRRPFYYLKRYCVDYLPFMKQYISHLFVVRKNRTRSP